MNTIKYRNLNTGKTATMTVTQKKSEIDATEDTALGHTKRLLGTKYHTKATADRKMLKAGYVRA